MVGKRGGFSNADIGVIVDSNAKYVADAFGVLDSRILGLDKTLNRLSQTMKKNNAIQKQMKATTKGVVSNLRDWLIILGQVRSAFLNVKMVSLDVVNAVSKVGSQFEKLTVLMTGLSRETDAVKRLEEVNSNTNYLINLAKQAPYSLESLQDAFVKMETVGLKPTAGSLQALTDAVSAFGGNDESIKRAAVALQQMGGKGVVSMEELRQQLGEAVPSALKMMARGAGLSIEEFTKKVSLGVVDAETAIQAMNKEFAMSFSGASKKLMETYDGLLSQFRTEWSLFLKEISDSGFYDVVKEGLQDLIKFMGSAEGKEWAQSLGVALTNIAKALRVVIDLFVEWGKVIASIIAVVIGKNIIMKMVLGFASLTEGVLSFNKGFGFITPALKKAYTAFGKTGGAVKFLTLAIAALRAVITPLSFVITGLITAFLVWKQKSDDTAKSLQKVEEEMNRIASAKERLAKGEKVGVEKLTVDYSKKKFEAAKGQIKDLAIENQKLAKQSSWLAITEKDKQLKENAKAQIEANNAEIERLQEYVDLQRAVKKSANVAELKDSVDLQKKIDDERTRLAAEYQKKREDIDKKRQSSKYTEAQLDQEVKEALAARINGEEDLLKLVSETEKKMTEGKNLQAPENRGYVVFFNGVREKIKSVLDLIQEDTEVTFLGAEKAVKDALTAYEKQVLAREQARAKLEGLEGFATKFTNKQKAEDERALKALELKNVKAEDQLVIMDKALKATQKETQALKKQLDVQKENERNSSRARRELQELAVAYQKRAGIAEEAYKADIKELPEIIRLTAELAQETDKLTGAEKQRQIEKNKDIVSNARIEAIYRGLLDVSRETENVEAEIVKAKTKSSAEIINLEYNRRLSQRITSAQEIQDEQKKQELITQIYKEESALRDAQLRLDAQKNRNALESMFDDWEKLSDNFWGQMADTVSDATDELINFCETGKMNFQNLIDDMLRGLAKLMAKALIARTALAFMTGGASGAAEPGMGFLSGLFHTGGVVGKEVPSTRMVSPEDFAGATKYHSGGITGLKSDEIPAILQKGEGVFTKEQMAAMGGQGGATNVQVNVINQTSQPVSAEQGTPKFDGEKMVLDIVLRAVNSPGGFRDGMRGAVR